MYRFNKQQINASKKYTSEYVHKKTDKKEHTHNISDYIFTQPKAQTEKT